MRVVVAANARAVHVEDQRVAPCGIKIFRYVELIQESGAVSGRVCEAVPAGSRLIWQLAYAEFYFTDTLWPDFDKESLKEAIRYYNGRERRFGGVK